MSDLRGCKSKTVALTAFGSSPVSRARLTVKVSAMRKCMRQSIVGMCSHESFERSQRNQLADELMYILVNLVDNHAHCHLLSNQLH